MSLKPQKLHAVIHRDPSWVPKMYLIDSMSAIYTDIAKNPLLLAQKKTSKRLTKGCQNDVRKGGSLCVVYAPYATRLTRKRQTVICHCYMALCGWLRKSFLVLNGNNIFLTSPYVGWEIRCYCQGTYTIIRRALDERLCIAHMTMRNLTLRMGLLKKYVIKYNFPSFHSLSIQITYHNILVFYIYNSLTFTFSNFNVSK